MVVFEELGGDVTKISLVKKSVSTVCADAFENHPNLDSYKIDSAGGSSVANSAKIHLQCAPGQTISSIKFASFGTPFGTCGSFYQGRCHAANSRDVFEKAIYLFKHSFVLRIGKLWIHIYLISFVCCRFTDMYRSRKLLGWH